MLKQRVSVPLSQTFYNEIQKKSEQMGITMSSYISFVVGNHLQAEIKMIEALSNQLGKTRDDMSKEDVINLLKNSSKAGE